MPATTRSKLRPLYEELYQDVFGYDTFDGGTDSVLEIIPEDVSATLAFVFTNHPSLTDRERNVMRLRYIDDMSLHAIGKMHCVTSERIRQSVAKATRKIRTNGLHRLILRYGIGLYEDAKAEYDITRKAQKEAMLTELARLDALERRELPVPGHVYDIPITKCDFSVRTTRALCHHGTVTVGQLSGLRMIDLMHIRNLGRKCLKEILLWLDSKNIDAEVFCDPDAQLLLAEAKSEMEVTTPCQGKEI